MRFDFDQLSKLLDEPIEKGLKAKRISRVDQLEDEICKALSFDPFNPVTMNEELPYYNPYVQTSEGFVPHRAEHWAAAGKKGDYSTNEAFWSALGEGPKPSVGFRGFIKSIPDFVIKGAPVPVGTIHTFRDGQDYKKVADGSWKIVARPENKRWGEFLNDKRPKVKADANQELEGHASKTLSIKNEMKQREREDRIVSRAKNEAVQAAIGHTHEALHHVYDGAPPKELTKLQKEATKRYSPEGDKKSTTDHLKTMGGEFKPKTHHVHVQFVHQGREYSHRFPNVEGASHGEAIERVTEGLKEKLPGAVINKIHAESVKPAKPTAERGQE